MSTGKELREQKRQAIWDANAERDKCFELWNTVRKEILNKPLIDQYFAENVNAREEVLARVNAINWDCSFEELKVELHKALFGGSE